MVEPDVLLDRVDVSTAIIRLNRPSRRNAIGANFATSLNAVLDEIERDRRVVVAVLTGNGSAFCAGGDISEIMSPDPTDRDEEFALLRSYHKLVGRIHHFDIPIIAAVNGPAVGGGASLAMACDVALGSHDAYYSLAFQQIGLSGADMGATTLLQRQLGPMRASHLILTGGSITAQQAVELGLFVEAVASEDLIPRAIQIAASIAAGGRGVATMSKLSLRRGALMELEAALEYEAFVQSYAFQSPTHKMRIQQIREKGMPHRARP